jgi:hypothetical protein
LPITESLAGAHTYVTTNMKAGTGGGVSGASCGGTVEGTVTWTDTAAAGFTLDLGFGQFSSTCWEIVLPHLQELELDGFVTT